MTHELPLLSSGLNHLSQDLPAPDGPGSGTHLFDALCEASEKVFGPSLAVAGRRALIVLTDAEDTGSRHTRDEAIACAQRAGVVVYIVFYSAREAIDDARFDPRVLVFTHEHLPGRTNAERIARSTGGRVFLVGHLSIDSIYAEVQRELRSQYRIAFTPPTSPPGSFHTLTLKPRDKHLSVQTRPGYYAP